MTAGHPPSPGDELLPDAGLVFDRGLDIEATPAQIWPWLIQLGKSRAGWYMPRDAERFIPRGRRATRSIDERWQALAVGERIPDYGGSEGYLEVARIEEPSVLVYRSDRGSARFTWALLLSETSPGVTHVHLRFRAALKSAGLKRRAIVSGGDFFDWATTELMLRGLRERVAASMP